MLAFSSDLFDLLGVGHVHLAHFEIVLDIFNGV